MALWAAISIYCLLSLFYGATGICAFNELISNRDFQKENIRKLGQINTELKNYQNSLLFDIDTINVFAHKLGFGNSNEKYIRIVGLSGINNAAFSAGEIVKTPLPVFINDKIIKICALISGIITFLIMLIHENLNKLKQFL